MVADDIDVDSVSDDGAEIQVGRLSRTQLKTADEVEDAPPEEGLPRNMILPCE